jgi:hypothetical protein
MSAGSTPRSSQNLPTPSARMMSSLGSAGRGGGRAGGGWASGGIEPPKTAWALLGQLASPRCRRQGQPCCELRGQVLGGANGLHACRPSPPPPPSSPAAVPGARGPHAAAAHPCTARTAPRSPCRRWLALSWPAPMRNSSRSRPPGPRSPP